MIKSVDRVPTASRAPNLRRFKERRNPGWHRKKNTIIDSDLTLQLPVQKLDESSQGRFCSRQCTEGCRRTGLASAPSPSFWPAKAFDSNSSGSWSLEPTKLMWKIFAGYPKCRQKYRLQLTAWSPQNVYK